MKVLYYGGQKSGKSRLAEAHALALTYDQKPHYIATYDRSYADEEMAQRIARHQAERRERFISVEEPFELPLVIGERGTYLIDCLSMWIFNTLDVEIEELYAQLNTLASRDANILFVLNEVNSGIIPMDPESRAFVDRTGMVGQWVASLCDEVYEVKLGLPRRLK